jgi:hypothetical protein
VRSVLAGVTREDVAVDPFPHVVVRDAVEDAVCTRLLEELPPLERLTRGAEYKSNQRFDYRASDVLRDSSIGPTWRQMIETHVSQGFLDEALGLFGDDIRRIYPWLEGELGALGSLRAGVRRVDTFARADVLLDAQIAVNTPVTGPATSVRRGHLDLPDKLFVALLYLRHPDDDSEGGDLELYRYATDRPVFEGQMIGDEQLELVRTVPYERNVLVFFLNCPTALHGVTARSPTVHPRFFMNVVAEVPRRLFDLDVPTRARPAPRARTARGRALALARRARSFLAWPGMGLSG